MAQRIVRAMNRMVGQPSMAKSVLVSIAVHSAAFSAIYSWPIASTDRFTMQGQRDVIQLSAPASTPTPAEVVIKREDTPLDFDNDELVPVAYQPRELRQDLPHAEELANLDKPSELEPTEEAELQWPTPPPMSRRQSASPEPTVKEVKLPRRQKRPVTTLSPPTPSAIPIEQIVGLDKKTPPDLSNNPLPEYPAEAVRQRLEGTVLLRLRVDPSGDVEEVEIVKSSGHRVLDRSAVDAVAKWHGQPATRAGKPVATVEFLPVRFRL